VSVVKAAVIGCGAWGRHHVRIYKELPNVELVMVIDANPEKAREIARKYNISWDTSPDKVFGDPEIQVLSICTPTVTHADLAMRAIEHGKHVLVEKPMADSVEEAKSLIEAAKRHNVYLTVGFVERFNPAVLEAYKRIEQGQIGDVILVHAKRVSRRPERIGDVGVVKDLAIHDINIVDYLFKNNAVSVYATTGNIQHRYEDYANINIDYGNGRTAFIETNWLTPKRVRTLTITGTEGILNVEYTTQEISLETGETVTQPLLQYTEPLLAELQSFTDCVRNDTPPQITGEDGLRALQICEAALKSAETKRIVKMKEFLK